MKTKERWTQCPLQDGHLRRNDMLLTAKTSVLTNKIRKNAPDNSQEGPRSEVRGRKSVHEFCPPADGRHHVRPRREAIPKRSLAFNGNIDDIGTSDDVAESKGSYWFCGINVRKSRPCECNGLHDFKGGWSPKKEGLQKCRDIRRYL